MRIPAWVPYPNSWLRVASLFPFLPGVFLTSLWVPILLYWEKFPSKLKEELVPIVVWATLFLIGSYAAGHYCFSKQKGKMAGLRSLWAGAYAIFVLNISLVPAIWIFGWNREMLDFFGFSTQISDSSQLEVSSSIALNVWIVITAYLFQVELLIRKRWFP